MTITDFKVTKRGRIALYADDAFLMSLHPDVFAASGISVGIQLDECQLAELLEQAEMKKAKEKALSLLSYKEYTSQQLTERLCRQVGEDAAEAAVVRMEELGLIDDEDYAERFARDLSQRKRYGVLRIRQEMRRRGLSSEQIEHAVSQLEDDPVEQMQTIIERKYPLAREDEKTRQRAFQALLRMGYPSSEVRRALRIYQDEFDME